jgi:hypothetical protein
MYLDKTGLKDAAHDRRLTFGGPNLVETDLVAPSKIVRIDIDANVNAYTSQNHDLPELLTVTLVQ